MVYASIARDYKLRANLRASAFAEVISNDLEPWRRAYRAIEGNLDISERVFDFRRASGNRRLRV